MNIDFPLPVRFMWNTARTVLGKDKVPKQSAYRREVLAWRIDNILQNEEITSFDISAEWYFAEASLVSIGYFYKKRTFFC